MRNTRVFSAKAVLVCLMIVASGADEHRQRGRAVERPVDVAATVVRWFGIRRRFRVPAETVNGMSFSYGGQAVAYDPATNSLFVSSHGYVAEVSIPTPVNSSDVNAMPFATFLQPFDDPTEGHLRDVSDGDVKMDSLMVYGNRLYGTATFTTTRPTRSASPTIRARCN